MSRLKNGCEGKVKYRNKKAAMLVLQKLNIAGLQAYKCKVCHRWHLGNSAAPFDINSRLDQLLGDKK